jgi:GAF domain-containing protein
MTTSPRHQTPTGRHTIPTRERLALRAFVELADTLVDDFDIVDFLHGVSAASVDVLGADAAGVMLADGRGGLRLVASSEERMRLLELFEIQHDEGPCLDAYATGTAVQASAAEGLERWPAFAPVAAEQGFRFMCAVPLQLRGSFLGALNLFRSTDAAFTGEEMQIAQALAHVAAVGLLQQRALSERSLLAEQLQLALQSRVVIEQAKGMIAESLSIDVDAAFDFLRAQAHARNLELTGLARQIATREIDSTTFRELAAEAPDATGPAAS